MPDAFWVSGTMCKVKKEENLFWGDSQLPSQNARTKVRLLYLMLVATEFVVAGASDVEINTSLMAPGTLAHRLQHRNAWNTS